MTEDGVRLTISIAVEGRTTRIAMRDSDGRTVSDVTTEFASDQLLALRREVRRGLDIFRRTFAGQVVNKKVAERALEDFHATGRTILHRLYGNNFAELDRASKACRAACGLPGQWESSPLPCDARAAKPRLILIDTRSQDGIAPELLPFLNPLPPDYAADPNRFGRIARDFLGFAAIIHRAAPTLAPLELDNTTQLPLRIFRHKGLNAAASMPDFFRRDGLFELDCEWPRRQSDPNDATRLAELLWRGRTGAAGEVRKRPIQIHHFACHCDAHPQSGRSELRFKGDGFPYIGETSIDVVDLKGRLSDFQLKSFQNGDLASRPLVFLNACGTADGDPDALTSLPKVFESPFFLGVIATQCPVPDWFATDFSKRFYERLLSGSSVGQALFDARWEMMMKRRNPFGLIYTLYAPPNMKVSRAIPSDRLNKTRTAGANSRFP